MNAFKYIVAITQGFAVRVCTLASLMIIAAAPAVNGQVFDNTIYVADNTTAIYTLNVANGATTRVGTLLFATTGMGRDPATGRVYYASTNNSTVPDGQVAYWDPGSGTNTLLNAGGAPGNDNIIRMAFSPSGILYGIGSSSNLYSISTATGAYTNLGTITVPAAGGIVLPANGDMAFDSTGVLYLVADATATAGTASLYTVNVAALTATEIGVTVPGSTLASLAVGLNGKLYAGGRGGGFYDVNRVTGAGTLIANTGFPYYDFASEPKFADLSITKTAPGGFSVGQNGLYSLNVHNAGPSSGSGPITVSDTLPAGLTYVSAAGAGWACSAVGSVVTCTLPGPLAAGANAATITLTVAIGAGAAPSVTNTASVSGTTIDPTPGNNSSTLTKSVMNVKLVKSVSPTGTQPPGTDLTFTINYSNSGASATTFVILDPIPANTDFKIGSEAHSALPANLLTVAVDYFDSSTSTWITTPVSGGGGAPAGYNRNVTKIRWTFTGSLATSGAGNVSFAVRIR